MLLNYLTSPHVLVWNLSAFQGFCVTLRHCECYTLCFHPSCGLCLKPCVPPRAMALHALLPARSRIKSGPSSSP